MGFVSTDLRMKRPKLEKIGQREKGREREIEGRERERRGEEIEWIERAEKENRERKLRKDLF